MGRSKFPGKPSKHINRKRINVLPCTILPNKDNENLQQYSSGTFADNNLHSSTEQVLPCVDAPSLESRSNISSSTTQKQVVDKETKLPVTRKLSIMVRPSEKITADEKLKILCMSQSNEAKSEYQLNEPSVKRSCRKNNENLLKTKLKGKRVARKSLEVGICENEKCTNIRKPLYGVKTRKKSRSCTKVSAATGTSVRTHDSFCENASLAGKFVLPSRSMHSSRVITPNKKFINNDLHSGNSECTSSKACFKRRIGPDDKGTKEEKCEKKCTNIRADVQVVSVPVIAADTVLEATSNQSSGSGSSWQCGGKLVLRKARLQLHSPESRTNDGPFSSYAAHSGASNSGPPGTVTCGVCGAVRFYRFVKQARKFNIYSCESCRKFISKMIKRQSCSKSIPVPMLLCHKGQGMCHVPPIVRSQQWKLIRCAYKARCPACWLKMCLRSFQMPVSLKNSLAGMLPENMRLSICSQPATQSQNCDVSISNTRVDLTTKLVHWQQQSTFAKSQLTERFAVCPAVKTDVTNKLDVGSNKKKKRRKSRLRVRKTSVVKTNEPDCTKRQKLDLKGPRVKHVCRSASIVLGQPIATFAAEIVDASSEATPSPAAKTPAGDCKNGQTTEPCVTCEPHEHSTNETAAPSSADCSRREDCGQATEASVPVLVTTRSPSRSPSLPPSVCPFPCPLASPSSSPSPCNDADNNNKNVPKCRNASENLVTISNEFRECELGLDSDCGYELLGTEPFPVHAVCYLCGSAGIEQMIHCASCCEPYHTFCLGDSILPHLNSSHGCSNAYPMTNPYWRFNWTCYKCTRCSSCGDTNKNKSICQKCFKYYHYKCMNPKWKQNNKLLVCYNCICCRMCGSQDISKVVCNITLCTPCFKLRSKENSCPYCRKSCDENDFDTKMMECAECKSLVHTACEGISHEKYEVFKNSPLFVSYVCRNCSTNTNHSNWEDILQLELKYNFHSVLRTLSRSRLARKLLKWGRMRNHTYTNSTLTFKYVKNKINCDSYSSIKEFHRDVARILHTSDGSRELNEALGDILKDMFPWYESPEDGGRSISAESSASQAAVLADLLPAVDAEALARPTETDASRCESVVHLRDSAEDARMALGPMERYVCTYEEEARACVDGRKCALCGALGDRATAAEGRLLYCGYDQWVHVHCAFWSTDVHEDIDGAFRNVHKAIARSRTANCSVCRQLGASIYCCFKSCPHTYHFSCARNVNCAFFHDSRLYCSSHYDRSTVQDRKSIVQSDRDFQVLRPVFIEAERKKECLVDANKVRYLLGSLSVVNLGVFFPNVSDMEEAIVTSNFVCTRLFWSTVEPWKIVQYTISTYVMLPKWHGTEERHFTVDYSQDIALVEKHLREMEQWRKQVECGRQGTGTEWESTETARSRSVGEERVVQHLLEHVLEAVCRRELEQENSTSSGDYTPEESDEPQNTADLLPPELKDAIFEDLPHDLLDGISMQDIFPKLMSYEDVVVDLKNTDLHDSNDFLKDSKIELANDIINLDAEEFMQVKCKKNEAFVNDGDTWPESKNSIQDEYNQSSVKKSAKNRSHQRSCSLTWSCKLDNSLSTNIKKRKVSGCSKNSGDISSNLFMVVDSAMTVDGGKASMLQELRLPDGVLMTVGRSGNADCMAEVRELKYRLEENSIIAAEKLKANIPELGKENKCRVWPNRSQPRLLQVDGADDMSSSDSECDNTQRCLVGGAEAFIEEPVQCARCQCTYRTHSSYNKHLLTCDFISSSESDSDNSAEPDQLGAEAKTGAAAKTHISQVENKVIIAQDASGEANVDMQVGAQVTTNADTAAINIMVVPMARNNEIQPTTVTNIRNLHLLPEVSQTSSNVARSPHVLSRLQVSESKVSSQAPVMSVQKGAVYVNKAGFSPANITAPHTVQLVKKKKLHRPAILRRGTNARGRGRPARLATVARVRTENPIHIMSQSQANRMFQLTQPQHCTNSNPATIIIQHMPSGGLTSLPTYIDAFQQQPGQNMQCIVNAGLLPNAFDKTATYVTSMPGVYQLQPDSGNITALPIVPANATAANSSVSGCIIPGLQLGQQVLIQQQPTRAHAAALQCGMLTSEQVMVATPTATLDGHTAVPLATGGMFLTTTPATTQPVYYGFETIVQNTVMQSQQFLSTGTLPGPSALLSNSSYSATTTQVFQASKIEPVLDMNSATATGYIIVNQPSAAALVSAQMTNAPHTQSHPHVAHNNQSALLNIVQNRGTPATTAIFPQQAIAESHTIIPIQTTPHMLNEPTTAISIQAVDSAPKYIENNSDAVHPVTFVQQPSLCTASVAARPAVSTVKTVAAKAMPQQGSNNSMQTASITLPVAPYGGIENNHSVPMNIVTPIPQAPQLASPSPCQHASPSPATAAAPVSSATSVPATAAPQHTATNHSRPMNRVLPMQTCAPKDVHKTKQQQSPLNKVVAIEPPDILNRLSETVDKIQETLNAESDTILSSKTNMNDNQMLKLESASLKLVFQKQSQDGIYKISNKYVSKSNVPLQKTTGNVTKTKTKEVAKCARNSEYQKLQDTTNSQEQNQQQQHYHQHHHQQQPLQREQDREQEQFAENNPHMVYKISSADGYERSSTSLTELWEKVFEAVQKARAAHNMPPLPQHAFDMISGLQLVGLKNNGLRYMMEQLPGAARCISYKRGFHKDKPQPDSDDRIITPKGDVSLGAIRCLPSPNKRQNHPYDMFSWLASKHRKPCIQVDNDITSRRMFSVNLPVAMRYRQLKETFKQAVGVYPSKIHGRGLFCLRNIDSGEMVIEYTGEVIRSTLTDKREKYYNSKSIGCYMFRIDDNLVIDATMKGNAARFINHSCDPNCYSRVLDILGRKHIIIFALRKIIQGEELTYDYKFPFEEDKIPCTCGSKKCRKYLN